MDIRCPSKMHGIVIDDDTIEIKCDSRFCGARPGVTVLHRFNSSTGELVSTQQFKDPQKGEGNGTDKHTAAVRAS